MTATATRTHFDDGAGWALSYPATWETVHSFEGASLVIREPPRNEDLFRANVNVVTQSLGKDFDIGRYARDQAAALARELQSAFPIDVRGASQGEELLVGSIVLAHVVDGIRVTLMQWHYRLATKLLVLSATVETIEFAVRREELEGIAGSVKLRDA
ncbi:MAG: hypothetical protein ACT452_16015 [Microthrixaceae bacterium]